MKPYEALKQSVKPLNTATREQMAPFANKGSGSRTAFTALIDELSKTGGGSCARDVLSMWKASQ
jgi:hypothetical protein